jgi:hypothetical protein
LRNGGTTIRAVRRGGPLVPICRSVGASEQKEVEG